jgi:hypothetical protein
MTPQELNLCILSSIIFLAIIFLYVSSSKCGCKNEKYSNPDKIYYSKIAAFNPNKYKNPTNELAAEADLFREHSLPSADELVDLSGKEFVPSNVSINEDPFLKTPETVQQELNDYVGVL